MAPSNLLLCFIHAAGALWAVHALSLVLRQRVALIALWGGSATTAVVLAVALAGLLSMVAAWRTLRRPRDLAAALADLRGMFSLWVGGAVVVLVWLQPFRRLVFDVALAITLGACAGVTLLAPTLRRIVPARPRFVIGFLLFNVALVAVLAELALRGFAAARPSPLFARVDVAVADKIDALRYAPGELRFGFPCNTGGHYDEEFRPRRPGERTMAVIGDSFSAGVVPHHYHFTTVCERELGMRVDNFGIPSVGPLEYEYLLGYEVLPLDPEVVLIDIFVGNDFMDASHVRRGSASLRRWFDRDNVFLCTVPHRLAVLAEERRQLGSAALAGRKAKRSHETRRLEGLDEVKGEFPWVVDYRLEPVRISRAGALAMERSRAALNCTPGALRDRSLCDAILRMRAAVGERAFGVVIIPDIFQVEDWMWDEVCAGLPQPEQLIRDAPQAALIEWLRAEGVAFLDLLPVLRAVPPEADGDRHLYHVNDSHFNARGNEAAGRAMAGFVRELVK